MTVQHRLFGTALSLALGVAAPSAWQQLGPKDGAGLRPDDVQRVRIGSAAPDFTLEDVDGRPATLSSYQGRYVVLVFYRGHW
jgi:cytochrome oxidase Cu insertion factor (SCO1/SenC/PrrC family)